VRYDHDHVTKAINEGADVIRDALDLGERDNDLLNLVINAAVTCMERPGSTFDDVVTANYAETPDEVRTWWDW
jgi:hypothetical protein